MPTWLNSTTGGAVAALAILSLAGCGQQGVSEGAANGSAPLQALGDPTDNTGVYTGVVGGKPGFMVSFQTLHAQPFTVTSITQRGGDVSAFGGGGRSTTEQRFDFKSGWPNGGGQIYERGVLADPSNAILTGEWIVSERISGDVRRSPGGDSLLAFDLKFDPITLSSAPAGNAIPERRYDILHAGTDIGDFTVAAPGAGSGEVAWPGAGKSCPIGVSTGVRAPGTTRNVWQVQFNTEVACSPPVWSVGYATTDAKGALTFELFASRQLANHSRPAPAGEQDAMNIQLRRR